VLVFYPQLGGLNSTLSVENARSIPLVSSVPTLIIGMDVSHGSPGRADVPSIAAVELPFFQYVLSILFAQIILFHLSA